MKASELIQKLQAAIDENGDRDVYSIIDYGYVEGVAFSPDYPSWISDPVILLVEDVSETQG